MTQPLDVGVFGPLNRAYSKETDTFVRAHVNHITKVEFFLAFCATYMACMTLENIAGCFRGTSLVAYSTQALLSRPGNKLGRQRSRGL